jgi:hypothetical protein
VATLISRASGNFTSSSTWAVVTSELDSEASSIGIFTSNTDSPTFVLSATTIDAVALKIMYATYPTPSGTVSVTLRNSTTSTNIATITVNATDLLPNPTQFNNNYGWYVFPFGSNHTPNGTDSYLIRTISSSLNSIRVYANATAGNYSRMFRTTTQQAPASGDKLVIAGEFTGVGTGNSFTVTMNNTSNVPIFGLSPGSTPQSITVNARSTLNWGTAVTTNYNLKWQGIFGVMSGGTMNIGTSGTPIPSSSTAVLDISSTSNADSGLVVFYNGTFNAYGASKTTVSTLLTSNSSVGATSITVASTAGWATNDEVCIASTSRTRTETENRTISSVTSSTTATLATSLSFAHSGTSPTQAEVGNITRNVKIQGSTTSNSGYVYFTDSSNVTCRYVEFGRMGSSTFTKRGVEATTTIGILDIRYCVIRDANVSTSSGGFVLSGFDTLVSDVHFNNNVLYNLGGFGIKVDKAIGLINGIVEIDSNLVMLTTQSCAYTNNPFNNQFTNNSVAASANHGIEISSASNGGGDFITMSYTSNTSHSNLFSGFYMSGSGLSGSIISTKLYRNGSIGMNMLNVSTRGLHIESGEFFGNNSVNLGVYGKHELLYLNLLNLYSETSFTTAGGIGLANTSMVEFTMQNCVLGGTSAAQNHTIADISAGGDIWFKIRAWDCKFNSSTEIQSPQDSMSPASILSSDRHAQLSGNFKVIKRYGTVARDTTIFRSVSPSMRLTPRTGSSTTGRLDSSGFHGGFFIPAANGQTKTISIAVRKSTTSDGANYTGGQPRLVAKRNTAIGITSDTVIATATGSNGSWEVISGSAPTPNDNGVLEIVVDCYGSTGWVNIDDLVVSG